MSKLVQKLRELIFVRMKKNFSRDKDFNFFHQKLASLNLHALYITCIKSLFINFSFLSRLAHSLAVLVGARLASVDLFSTFFCFRIKLHTYLETTRSELSHDMFRVEKR